MICWMPSQPQSTYAGVIVRVGRSGGRRTAPRVVRLANRLARLVLPVSALVVAGTHVNVLR